MMICTHAIHVIFVALGPRCSLYFPELESKAQWLWSTYEYTR